MTMAMPRQCHDSVMAVPWEPPRARPGASWSCLPAVGATKNHRSATKHMAVPYGTGTAMTAHDETDCETS